MEENMHASDIACSLSDEAFRELRWSHFVGQFGSGVKVYSVV